MDFCFWPVYHHNVRNEMVGGSWMTVDSRCRAACMKAARLVEAEPALEEVVDTAVVSVTVALNWLS